VPLTDAAFQQCISPQCGATYGVEQVLVACPACGDTIRAVEYRSYTVNYCPTCQTGGRVLAANTTSKFLK
jgi:predicted RNA-binding Zn-ribbon protein involved in translation (DUF1610 family)